MSLEEVNKVSYFVLLKTLWLHLQVRRRRQFTILLLLMVISSFAEMISIGAVIPFLGALTAPYKLMELRSIKEGMVFFGISSSEQLLLALTIIFCIAAVLAATLRLLLLWANTKFSFAIGADLSRDVYRKTLYQPYAVHVEKNSSSVINGVAVKVTNIIYGVILPILVLISSLVILLVIFIALLAIQPIVGIIAVGGFGSIYGGIIFITRKKLIEDSQKISTESTLVIKNLQEGLGGIRDVLIDGAQEMYCNSYAIADLSLRKAQASGIFISQSPRYFMEALGIIIIAIIAYQLTSQSDGVLIAIPVLGSIALAAQRALPVLQQAYSSWASIKGTQAGLCDVIEMLNQPVPEHLIKVDKISKISFNHRIELKKVSFAYGKSESRALYDIDLQIKKGECIGFIGKTGSGKSTLIDIIMGLLEPTDGSFLVDGISINTNNNSSWQKNIAHVPQVIFLSDSSIAENIAFGIPKEKIDYDKVRQASEIAQLDSTIKNLPLGYDTVVGERGIRFSGGQRQRIGIARAIYKNANILIFDEATSALDTKTERELIDSIGALPNSPTVLMIAHRLSTLKRCQKIIELDSGKISRVVEYSSLASGEI